MQRAARWHATPYGDTVRWVIGDDETAGAYSLHERIAPPGARSTAHSHSKLIESFYVLEGCFEFVIGGERIDATPGTFASAQRGVSHEWRVVGGESARALILFSPSAKLAYFEEVDAVVRAAAGARPDPDKLLELAKRYDWL
jgi:quercetin dioxygenase-like cupin family protein